MRAPIAVLTLLVAIVTAEESRQDLVDTTIDSYPAVAVLLRTVNYATTLTACGGSILNNRAILTAARCFEDDGPERWSFRLGSSAWNSSGLVYPVSTIIRHEDWDEWAMMTDIAIVHTASNIAFGASIQPGVFGSYAVPIGDPVTVVGWGYNALPIWSPTVFENLRQVQLNTLNLDFCRPSYSAQGFALRESQFCTGFSNTDENTVALNQYFGEPGMPVYHGPNIVGIRSYTLGFQHHTPLPSINTHFGSYLEWILANA